MTSSRSLIDSSDLPKSLEGDDLLLGGLENFAQLDDTKTGDLDLPNILVAYLIPLPYDRLREEYRKAQHNIHIWQAWEEVRTEGLVQDKIKSGDLPEDNSYESKLKRTAYRVKVILFLREFSNWLISISDDQSDTNVEVHESEASTAVLGALSNLLPDAFKEVDILLRPISRGILEGRVSEQQYLFTFVTHLYDPVQRRIFTTIHSLFVIIQIEKSGAQDKLKISVRSTNTGLSFLHRQWQDEGGKIGKSIIEAGEKILAKRSLHLTLPSSL